MDIGAMIPAVQVTGQNGAISLTALTGKAVIYFYPKDDTAGCTREAQDFSAMAEEFAAAGARVIGISKDSVASHDKFKKKHSLAVELASDGDGQACDAFGVWGEKQMYGRTYMGIERATFLFDGGRLVREWRKVKVLGHAQAVLDAVRDL